MPKLTPPPRQFPRPLQILRAKRLAPQNSSMRDAIPEYVLAITAHTRVSLDRFEGACFARWLERWTLVPIKRVSPDEIVQYLQDRKDTGSSDRELDREKRLLRSFFRWAQRCGTCVDDPTVDLDAQTTPLRIPTVFWSAEEEQRLLDVCRGVFPTGTNRLDSLRRPPVPPPYMQFLVLLGLRTGLRSSHLLGLEWTQVDLRNGTITVPAAETWNGRDIVIQLDADSRQAIAELLRQAQSADSLPRRVLEAAGMPIWRDRPDDFTVCHALNRLARAAVAPEGGFDALRLTHARRAAEAGQPILEPVRAGDWEDATPVREVYEHVEKSSGVQSTTR